MPISNGSRELGTRIVQEALRRRWQVGRWNGPSSMHVNVAPKMKHGGMIVAGVWGSIAVKTGPISVDRLMT